MKIIVTHNSPDIDAIASVWLIKKFLPGWEIAIVKFVSAGERIDKGKWKDLNGTSPVESIEDDEVIHADTGLGFFDHHQIASDEISAASLTWDYIKIHNPEFSVQNEKIKDRIEAISRVIKVIIDIDHFKEIFWKDSTADYHEFNLINILEGLKIQFPNQDDYYVEFISKSLDAILHEFENRVWAEKEISNVGQKFNTKAGPGIGLETINDSVIKLAQKMGYVIAVRKDPRKGYVRIKAVPSTDKLDIDLTSAYEKLKVMDPSATWYLHISKKMLLNGSVKSPKMRASKLGIKEIIEVLREI